MEKEKEFIEQPKTEDEPSKEWQECINEIRNLTLSINNFIREKEKELTEEKFSDLFEKYEKLKHEFSDKIKSKYRNEELLKYIAWHGFVSSTVDNKSAPKLDFPELYNVKRFFMKIIEELGVEIKK
jgi:predicted ATP-binding protein involved in virulence